MSIEIESRPLRERLALSGIDEKACEDINKRLNNLLTALPAELRLALLETNNPCLRFCTLTFLSLLETGRLAKFSKVGDIVALLVVIGDLCFLMSGKNPLPDFVITPHRLRKALASDDSFSFFTALKRLSQGKIPLNSLKLKRPLKDLAELHCSVLHFLAEQFQGKSAFETLQHRALTADVLYLLLAADEKAFARIVLLEESPLTGSVRAGFLRTKAVLTRLKKHNKTWAQCLTEKLLTEALTASGLISQMCLVTDPTQGLWATRTLANVSALEIRAEHLHRLLLAKADDAKKLAKPFGFQTFEAIYRVESFNELSTQNILLPVSDVFVSLPQMPHPVVTMLREALAAVESHMKTNPSLTSFYWIAESCPRDTTPQKACAIFIPRELLPMPEIFWTRRLMDAGTLVDSDPFLDCCPMSAPAFGQTIDAQVHALSINERKAQVRMKLQNPDSAVWPSVKPDTNTFVDGFLFRLSHTTFSDATIATLMQKKLQACEFRAMQVALDLENRAQAFLNPVAVKTILKDYDTEFMRFAQGITLAELIRRNPQVKLKLEMMNHHRQKKMRQRQGAAACVF